MTWFEKVGLAVDGEVSGVQVIAWVVIVISAGIAVSTCVEVWRAWRMERSFKTKSRRFK